MTFGKTSLDTVHMQHLLQDKNYQFPPLANTKADKD